VAEGLKPDFVLALGPWPTSKVLRSWLAAADVPAWLVSAHPENRDALHVRSRQVAVDLRAFAAQLPAASGSKTNAYEKSWAGFEQRARTAIEAQLGRSDPAFEGRCAWALGQHLPRGTAVIVANSMPVRDVEYFWPANDRGTRVFVNRGGNGIDGTLSSAVGVAHGNGARAVLLTGDLALLHDSNGFLLRSKLRGSLTIVLINNRGGGIFNHLPIAQFEPPFEEYFATPQDIDFATLCRAHGVEHTLVRDPAHFSTLVSELPATGMRVFEVRTDRKADAATRKRIFAEVAAGLEPG
jgi:2-succinyl-5-enolpyruvyl-6-hydroxy-3-cyclohexene-1-carboxylate synthase